MGAVGAVGAVARPLDVEGECFVPPPCPPDFDESENMSGERRSESGSWERVLGVSLRTESRFSSRKRSSWDPVSPSSPFQVGEGGEGGMPWAPPFVVEEGHDDGTWFRGCGGDWEGGTQSCLDVVDVVRREGEPERGWEDWEDWEDWEADWERRVMIWCWSEAFRRRMACILRTLFRTCCGVVCFLRDPLGTRGGESWPDWFAPSAEGGGEESDRVGEKVAVLARPSCSTCSPCLACLSCSTCSTCSRWGERLSLEEEEEEDVVFLFPT